MVTGILNFIKAIRVNSPIVVIIPVCCIMLLGVYLEFVGEYKRWADDKKVNATPVMRMALPGSAAYENSSSGKIEWERTCLAEVKVGDIIKVQD